MRWICFCLTLLLAGAGVAQEEPATQPVPEEEPVSAEEPGSDEEPAPEELPAPSQISGLKERFYLGGWLGASFGDVISVAEVAPEVGFIVVPKFHLGGSLVYRYRKDERFEPDLSTTDTGGALYGRYFVYAPIFLQAGVEQLNWEFPVRGADGGFEVVDADHTAVLIGPGFALPIGPKAASYMTFLYDVNYDSEGPNPYDRPWMIRVGIGIGL